MIVHENRCCDCASPGYPCRGSECPNRNVSCYYCDDCKDEYDELFYYEDEQLCRDCIIKRVFKDLEIVMDD